MIDIFDKKLYRGGFEFEEEASEFYDKIQINIFGIFVSFITLGNSQQVNFKISSFDYS